MGNRLSLPAVAIHRLGVIEIVPSHRHCFRTAHPCAQSVKSSATEPVLSRSSRKDSATSNGLPPYVGLIPVKRNNKSHHEKGYIQMYAKNDPYKNSFIPRTIPIWNRLPLDTVNSSNTETFKLALSKLSSW